MNEMLISALVTEAILFLYLISQHGKTALLVYLVTTGMTLSAFAVWGNMMTPGEGALAWLFFIASTALMNHASITRFYARCLQRIRTAR